MNKKLLTMLSFALLVSMLPACGKKDSKRTDKKSHYKKKEHKHRAPKKAHKSHKKDVMMDEEEMK